MTTDTLDLPGWTVLGFASPVAPLTSDAPAGFIGAPAARHAHRQHGAGHVHLGHDPAAENVAIGIDVGRHRHHAQHQLTVARKGHGREVLRIGRRNGIGGLGHDAAPAVVAAAFFHA